MKLSRGQKVALTIIMLLGIAVFAWAAWFVTKPTTQIARISTISFGLSLMLAIGALAWADEVTTSRLGRFLIDLLGGWLIAGWIHFYILGPTPNMLYILISGGVVLFVSLIFSLRKSTAKRNRPTTD